MPLHLNGASPGDYELPRLTGCNQFLSKNGNTPSHSFGKASKTTRKMPFISGRMVEGIIDKVPENTEVPFYN
jgi:hypothetical protein